MQSSVRREDYEAWNAARRSGDFHYLNFPFFCTPPQSPPISSVACHTPPPTRNMPSLLKTPVGVRRSPYLASTSPLINVDMNEIKESEEGECKEQLVERRASTPKGLIRHSILFSLSTPERCVSPISSIACLPSQRSTSPGLGWSTPYRRGGTPIGNDEEHEAQQYLSAVQRHDVRCASSGERRCVDHITPWKQEEGQGMEAAADRQSGSKQRNGTMERKTIPVAPESAHGVSLGLRISHLTSHPCVSSSPVEAPAIKKKDKAPHALCLVSRRTPPTERRGPQRNGRVEKKEALLVDLRERDGRSIQRSEGRPAPNTSLETHAFSPALSDARPVCEEHPMRVGLLRNRVLSREPLGVSRPSSATHADGRVRNGTSEKKHGPRCSHVTPYNTPEVSPRRTSHTHAETPRASNKVGSAGRRERGATSSTVVGGRTGKTTPRYPSDFPVGTWKAESGFQDALAERRLPQERDTVEKDRREGRRGGGRMAVMRRSLAGADAGLPSSFPVPAVLYQTTSLPHHHRGEMPVRSLDTPGTHGGLPRQDGPLCTASSSPSPSPSRPGRFFSSHHPGLQGTRASPRIPHGGSPRGVATPTTMADARCTVDGPRGRLAGRREKDMDGVEGVHTSAARWASPRMTVEGSTYPAGIPPPHFLSKHFSSAASCHHVFACSRAADHQDSGKCRAEGVKEGGTQPFALHQETTWEKNRMKDGEDPVNKEEEQTVWRAQRDNALRHQVPAAVSSLTSMVNGRTTDGRIDDHRRRTISTSGRHQSRRSASPQVPSCLVPRRAHAVTPRRNGKDNVGNEKQSNTLEKDAKSGKVKAEKRSQHPRSEDERDEMEQQQKSYPEPMTREDTTILPILSLPTFSSPSQVRPMDATYASCYSPRLEVPTQKKEVEGPWCGNDTHRCPPSSFSKEKHSCLEDQYYAPPPFFSTFLKGRSEERKSIPVSRSPYISSATSLGPSSHSAFSSLCMEDKWDDTMRKSSADPALSHPFFPLSDSCRTEIEEEIAPRSKSTARKRGGEEEAYPKRYAVHDSDVASCPCPVTPTPWNTRNVNGGADPFPRGVTSGLEQESKEAKTGNTSPLLVVRPMLDEGYEKEQQKTAFWNTASCVPSPTSPCAAFQHRKRVGRASPPAVTVNGKGVMRDASTVSHRFCASSAASNSDGRGPRTRELNGHITNEGTNVKDWWDGTEVMEDCMESKPLCDEHQYRITTLEDTTKRLAQLLQKPKGTTSCNPISGSTRASGGAGVEEVRSEPPAPPPGGLLFSLRHWNPNAPTFYT